MGRQSIDYLFSILVDHLCILFSVILSYVSDWFFPLFLQLSILNFSFDLMQVYDNRLFWFYFFIWNLTEIWVMYVYNVYYCTLILVSYNDDITCIIIKIVTFFTNWQEKYCFTNKNKQWHHLQPDSFLQITLASLNFTKKNIAFILLFYNSFILHRRTKKCLLYFLRFLQEKKIPDSKFTGIYSRVVFLLLLFNLSINIYYLTLIFFKFFFVCVCILYVCFFNEMKEQLKTLFSGLE